MSRFLWRLPSTQRDARFCEGAKKNRAGWLGFPRHLKERGLTGVRMIISDACLGLSESATVLYPDDGWQCCTAHFYRNVFSHLPRPKMREVAAMLKAMHAAEDVQAARDKAKAVVAKLREQHATRAAELVENPDTG